jgi:hypothetical protein
MSEIPKEIGVKYMAAWKNAVKVLQQVRASELLHSTSTSQGLLSLLPAFNACVAHRELSTTSGLIEQQRIFARARIK